MTLTDMLSQISSSRSVRRLVARLCRPFGLSVEPIRGTDRSKSYEKLYEEHATAHCDNVSIGDGDFDLIGRIELALLTMEGLQPEHTLYDLGCGTGRLAVHAVPYLAKGSYLGSDISESMLAGARKRIAAAVPRPTAQVQLLKQQDETFEVPEASIDFMCAFSVFTHMEPEDTLRYLKAARRVVRPAGKLVFSCLPLRLAAARQIFLMEAELDLNARWSRVRNFTTSVEQMEQISVLAGWEVVRWYAGDEPNVSVAPDEPMVGLGQSTCVLRNR